MEIYKFLEIQLRVNFLETLYRLESLHLNFFYPVGWVGLRFFENRPR